MMHWITDYLGKPWKRGATGPDAYDCLGLVRAVYRDQLGIAIPQAPTAINRRDWRRVYTPAQFDVAVMAHVGEPHIGLFVEGRLLESLSGSGVIAMDLASIGAHGRRVKSWYRYVRV